MSNEFEVEAREYMRKNPKTRMLIISKISGNLADVSCLSDVLFSDIRSLTFDCEYLTEVPKFPEGLKIEDLSIAGSDVAKSLGNLTALKKLRTLQLEDTDIKTASELKPLAILKDLRELELEDTAIAMSVDYVRDVFMVLPQLDYVDKRARWDYDIPAGSDASDTLYSSPSNDKTSGESLPSKRVCDSAHSSDLHLHFHHKRSKRRRGMVRDIHINIHL